MDRHTRRIRPAHSLIAAQLRARADARAVRWHRKTKLHGGTAAALRSLRGTRQSRRPPRRGEAGAESPRAAQRRTLGRQRELRTITNARPTFSRVARMARLHFSANGGNPPRSQRRNGRNGLRSAKRSAAEVPLWAIDWLNSPREQRECKRQKCRRRSCPATRARAVT
jgi:hypothetical protein